MKLTLKTLSTLLFVVVLLLLTTTIASMQGPAVQQVIMGSVTDTNCVGNVSVPINMTGLGGTGAVGFTLIIGVPTGSVAIQDSCTLAGQFATNCSAVAGGVPICAVADINDQGSGMNLYQLDAGCVDVTPPFTTPAPVLGDTLATIISVNRTGAPELSHVIDLLPSDGAGTFSQIVDASAATFNVPDGALIDGSVNWCPSTAVTMSGFDATTDSPAPFAAAAWPLLVGAAAVAAGGAYALLRRKS